MQINVQRYEYAFLVEDNFSHLVIQLVQFRYRVRHRLAYIRWTERNMEGTMARDHSAQCSVQLSPSKQWKHTRWHKQTHKNKSNDIGNHVNVHVVDHFSKLKQLNLNNVGDAQTRKNAERQRPNELNGRQWCAKLRQTSAQISTSFTSFGFFISLRNWFTLNTARLRHWALKSYCNQV